jgi:steroid delta-isomerase-like uncharacterized protein
MKKHARRLTLIGVLALAATVLWARAEAGVDPRVALIEKHLELLNAGRWQEASEMFSPDVRHHLGNWQAGQERIVTGRQALRDNLEDLYRTFPDWKMEILDTAASGESVVVRCKVSGTHSGIATKRMNGGFVTGVPATSKRFEFQHIHWYKIQNGLIADHFTNRDDLGMNQQLGLLPYPPAVPAK